MSSNIPELERRRAAARRGGGERRIEAQHAKGKLTARERGQPLATVEAMKMENILRSQKTGTVARTNAKEGETLMIDAVILELE